MIDTMGKKFEGIIFEHERIITSEENKIIKTVRYYGSIYDFLGMTIEEKNEF